MDSFVQADIFFFITSVAVCAVTILLCVALFHAIKILQDARRFLDMIKAEGNAIAEDVAAARQFVKKEGARLTNAVSHVGRVFSSRKKPRRAGGKRESASEGDK